MEHTKEPWSIDKYHNINTPEGQLGLGGVVTHCTRGPGMGQDRANARRIVACVNACAGLPTEYLEQTSMLGLSNSYHAQINAWSDLEQQRDELLVIVECAAVEPCISDDECGVCLSCQAREALAKLGADKTAGELVNWRNGKHEKRD